MTVSLSNTLIPEEPVWLFGYGSLIYKQDFPFLESRPAYITGWARRFWQGSHDHRGTPDFPGRVVTLVPSAGQVCNGLALLVEPDVFAHLDFREKNGYQREEVSIYLGDQSELEPIETEISETVTGLVYRADEENEAYLGPDSMEAIAAHIHQSHGPSGSNLDYLLHLAESLRALNAKDQHVFVLEDLVQAISNS